MDVQTGIEETAALVAFTQCLARLEAEEGFVSERAVQLPQVISENRFLAARDGINAELIDPDSERRVPVTDIVDDLLGACRPHAQDLGCEAQLDGIRKIAASNGAARQIELSRQLRTLPGLVAWIADHYAGTPAATPSHH
jgi:carboxylate-amine ligase